MLKTTQMHPNICSNARILGKQVPPKKCMHSQNAIPVQENVAMLLAFISH